MKGGVLDYLSMLQRYMEDPVAAPSVVDWIVVETELGTRLPRDYKELVEVYGSFVVAGSVLVSGPDSQPGRFGLYPAKGMLEALRSIAAHREHFKVWGNNGRKRLIDSRIVFEVEPYRVLPWGSTDTGYSLLWWIEGEPDSWTVVAAEGANWFDIQMSLSELLWKSLSQTVVFPGHSPQGWSEIDPRIQQYFGD